MTGPRKPAEKPDETGLVKPSEDELAAHEAEKYGDLIDPVAPEAVAVSEDPDKKDVRIAELEAQVKALTPVVIGQGGEWGPNAPCLNCGKRGYKWTVGWGQGCSLCAPDAPVAEDD